MVTYASSKLLAPSALDIDEQKLKDIYDSVHDLKAVNKATTPAEMQRLLDEHFFNLTTGSVDEEDSYTSVKTEVSSSANIVVEKEVIESSKEDINETDESTDEALKKLLADL